MIIRLVRLLDAKHNTTLATLIESGSLPDATGNIEEGT
jgi:hypothetical protein